MDKIWFKAKRIGYGWYPATKEGYIVVFTYVLLIIAFALQFAYYNNIAIYLIEVLISTLILVSIAYLKGEKAHWSYRYE